MPRTFRHMTLRYIFDRMIEKCYRRSHPDVPWLAPAAIDFLAGYLNASDDMLEFGSGRSTLWFAHRVHHISSVEHNPEWYAKISHRISDLSIANISYFLHPKQEDSVPAAESNYVKATSQFQPSSLDVVLVDGTYRAQCVLQSMPLMKSGGILVIDNVNRYLPSQSMAPNSRSLKEGPIDAEWQQVLELIGSWRFFWSSNGVSDTAIYFKP
jgi:predicted O-methyltransferase YrrM